MPRPRAPWWIHLCAASFLAFSLDPAERSTGALVFMNSLEQALND
jgi:hypothetical protein